MKIRKKNKSANLNIDQQKLCNLKNRENKKEMSEIYEIISKCVTFVYLEAEKWRRWVQKKII